MAEVMEPVAERAARPRTRRRPAFHPLRVASVQPLCDDAAAIGFDIPPELAEEFTHLPGQSLTLRREIDGRDERRSYSICTPAGSPPRIGVRVVPGGLFSSWLVNEVRPGDVVEVMGPTGFFTPDLGTPGHHVLIAAGSGITPMMSIAESVLAADDRSTVTLLYGNRRTGTVMFADELADLKDLHPSRFQLVHVLSREPREAELLSGRLDADRLSSLIDGLVDVKQADHWWLCGPHGMVVAAQQVLAGLGVPEERVHQELFYADDEPVREVHHEDSGPHGTRQRGDDHPRRPLQHRRAAPRTDRPRRRPEGPPRPALRLQGRRLRHLPRPGHRGHRGHAAQLRPGTGRGRRGLRPHLPVLSGVKDAGRRLRLLTGAHAYTQPLPASSAGGRLRAPSGGPVGPAHPSSRLR
ncbi:hypothetical protein GCM10020256_69270 [Streptomyces thermocoprophilus]